jgi:small GTP-binding protein
MTEPVFKCVVVGDDCVGKTGFLLSFATKTAIQENDYCPKVFDNQTMSFTVDQSSIKLALWEISNEPYNMRQMSYSDTTACLLCYAVDNPASFQNISNLWYPELLHHLASASFCIVALKTDLRNSDSNTITYEQGIQLAYSLGAAYAECTCRSVESCEGVFRTVYRDFSSIGLKFGKSWESLTLPEVSRTC